MVVVAMVVCLAGCNWFGPDAAHDQSVAREARANERAQIDVAIAEDLRQKEAARKSAEEYRRTHETLEEVALVQGTHATNSCSIQIVRKDTPINVRAGKCADIYETGEAVQKRLAGQAVLDDVRLKGLQDEMARAETVREEKQREVDDLKATIGEMKKSLAVAEAQAKADRQNAELANEIALQRQVLGAAQTNLAEKTAALAKKEAEMAAVNAKLDKIQKDVNAPMRVSVKDTDACGRETNWTMDLRKAN
ncbi:MAG: hypothetical protein A2358_02190 [Candidatus Staskawiczbacteria bacterium RIFOXYB1_FULL_37_44]|uniref:Uncharacterized protein n=1 Tax=Candidatus Staskawiczbacteria bacterium RIFOXYB1_FULL_37_44 TaxID=1802223 RepID=A0A1G2IUA8_9BACT|nr:MAG: hypothetical protein A2358_02190 [Candidatus Staskawiczbacteria bacterium RIFOXYB1_FULL_37_44]OGZ82798.1 MAG: hypothetical protein A2416_03170 [Candidatus Staskawiczbacteria bacterium RIFOXYC1_FULL_37_52]OGZ90569.1 MAG: hypothetical protein A2581_02630 [Candidatus Staskawiczbacteria bacterium RIFOXYD1_FULL_37_110]